MLTSLNDSPVLTLYQLSQLVKRTIENHFYRKYFWIKAEIHKLNVYKYSGHAYPELLEKQENEVICQMRGIIWKNDLLQINQKFIDTIGEPLKENITALLLVEVKYESKYGLSLQIKDIDPNYTLGELEKQKKQTIEQLKKEGISEHNKQLELSMVPQHLAIISVETSKGFNDLITTFQKYAPLYQITYDLYPSLLQGENAAVQIRTQLANIKEKQIPYDAVLIIRGGGGEIGLSCYNDYDLCKTIATFPIPVITGIGHSTNYTVAEMVAYQNGITPTDTAMIIIQRFEEFNNQLNNIQKAVIQSSQNFLSLQKQIIFNTSNHSLLLIKEIFHQQKIALQEYEQWLKNFPVHHHTRQEKNLIQKAYQIKHSIQHLLNNADKKLNNIKQTFKYSVNHHIKRHNDSLNQLQEHVLAGTHSYLQEQQNQIQNIEKNIQLLHPQNILKRGFCMAFTPQNKIIKNASQVAINDVVKIKFETSELITQVQTIKTETHESESYQ